MRRKDFTSVREALNGYQKGKCFYSFQDISISPYSLNLCDVDHFLPHINKFSHIKGEANINGVWNYSINRRKNARVPHGKFLYRLFNRNEFYISSKHPLVETIINQTGQPKEQRKGFLERKICLREFYRNLGTGNRIKR